MKNAIFALILMVGVTNVASLAEVQTLAAKDGPRTSHEDTYQLVEKDRRTGRDHQRSTRSAVTINNRPGDSTPIKTSSAVSSTKAKVNCPVCEDCKCASQEICDSGDCKKNYLVMFTAKWCSACPRMHRIMEQVKAEGYIVYFVDIDQSQNGPQFNITAVPTVIVMDQGKEVHRFVGVATPETIKEGVKKKDEQKTPKQTDYNFLD